MATCHRTTAPSRFDRSRTTRMCRNDQNPTRKLEIRELHPLSTLTSVQTPHEVPIWLAGLLTLGGVGATLCTQAISRHNSNRREDTWSCLRTTADFIAVGHAIIQMVRRSSSEECSPDSSGESGALHTADADTIEAYDRLEGCYATVVLALPALEPLLAPVRTKLVGLIHEGRCDMASGEKLKDDLDMLLFSTRAAIRFPIVASPFRSRPIATAATRFNSVGEAH